jgi:hypothetical protein
MYRVGHTNPYISNFNYEKYEDHCLLGCDAICLVNFNQTTPPHILEDSIFYDHCYEVLKSAKSIMFVSIYCMVKFGNPTRTGLDRCLIIEYSGLSDCTSTDLHLYW